MSQNIRSIQPRSIKGFTLVEALLAVFVAVFVFLATWSIYMMVWKWWHEIDPRIEAQRIGRLAISNIIDGTVDQTAGTYVINSVTYGKRNGIAWATASPDIPSQSEIDFQLEQDSSNIRAFYLGTDAGTGEKVVYYRDNNSVVHKLGTTRGITDLKFEKISGNNNLIKVTATVEKSVIGTRLIPYTIKIKYSDTAYLRNIAST